MDRIQRVLSLCVASVVVAGCAHKPPVVEPHETLVCGDNHVPEVRTLKFHTKSNGCVDEVRKEKDDSDAYVFQVCRGDTVRWKVSGPEKSVAFDKHTVSPFTSRSWPEPNSGFKKDKIEGVVDSNADQKLYYEYSVRTKGGPNDGCPLDPMIIVRY